MNEVTVSSKSRYGWVQERRVFVHAALLAADAAQKPGRGFAAADVRFYFLLFTNWVEHDVLHPGQDLDLTQVRRALERLVEDGWASRAGTRTGRRGGRFVLDDAGVLGLAASLSEAVETGRPFEEKLFVVCFASSYGKAVRERLRAHAAAKVATRRVASLLDPRALVGRARRTTRSLLADLEERVASGLELATEAARAEGDDDAIRRLEARGSYQLHRVRSLGDVLRALPEEVRRFELSTGLGLRVRLLFQPMAARARTELAQLEAIEASLPST